MPQYISEDDAIDEFNEYLDEEYTPSDAIRQFAESRYWSLYDAWLHDSDYTTNESDTDDDEDEEDDIPPPTPPTLAHSELLRA